MNFAFSEEQEEFREGLRRFLEETSPVSEVFRLMETPEGYDPGVWKRMGEELGLQGLCIPEDQGGQGFGFLELAVVFEEMGRVLLCAPYFSTVCLAASALLECGDPAAQRRWLPRIASGETIATLALLDEGELWDPGAVALELVPDGDGCVLHGRKRLVTDGATAELVLVAAREPGTRGPEGVTLLAAETGARGLTPRPLEPLDATRKLADLEFDGVRAEPVGTRGGAAPLLERVLDRARVALSMESVGGAQRCLDTAVAYARERVQFARPIGSFQAIKHRCAEALLELECARSTAYWASWAASEADDELPLAASVAKSSCDEAYLRLADDNIHIHGGLGVTWEAEPHLYLKRAKSTETLLGNPTWQRDRIARIGGY
jgi:alkylation response protein AidB-like acyl-CoA dehydrogenase